VKFACKAAGISRNTVYTHFRNDSRFRRQWERALDRGREAAYRLHRKQLAADPRTKRLLERMRRLWGGESWPFLALKSLIG
jgi:AcrR family transcriptional regulator